MNSNILLGCSIAFFLLGIVNILKPTMPYFSYTDNPEKTVKRGYFRVILGAILILVYYLK